MYLRLYLQFPKESTDFIVRLYSQTRRPCTSIRGYRNNLPSSVGTGSFQKDQLWIRKLKTQIFFS